MATEWPLVHLEDCLEGLIDYRGKSPPKSPQGIPVLSAKVIKDGRITEPVEQRISEADYKAWMRRGFPKTGDVVLTTEGPLGEVAQLDEATYALGQRIVTLRGTNGLLDNTFLKFLLKSSGVQHKLKSLGTGTTVEGISQRALRSVELPLPPFLVQRAIAHILGTLDDKIDLNRRMNETLEAMARALFKSWFVDFDPVRAKAEGRDPNLPQPFAELFPASLEGAELGEIPTGWRLAPIENLADIVGGSTPSTKDPAYWDGGAHFWATPKDLAGLSVPALLDTERRVTDAGLQQISSGLLPKGTVLLSSRAPIGYLAVAEIPVAINQGFIAMKAKKGISNLFLLFWADCSHDEIVRRANGSTFLEISKANFRPIPILTPPADVMDAFESLVRPLYERIVECERESRTLAALRDTLLPKLISGELRVKTAEKMVEAVA